MKQSKSDEDVRLLQVEQGAQVMAIALRSNNTAQGEALARMVEAIAQLVREEGM